MINVNELVVHAEQMPGIVKFYNFDELKDYLGKGLSVYQTTVYTTDNLEQAERDLKNLKEIKKKLVDKKKELETAYSMPIEEVKKQLDELLSMLKEPMEKIDKMIKDNAKFTKEKEIMAYARKRVSSLGEYADKVIESKAFFNEKWLNATCKTKEWKEEIDKKVRNAADAFEIINAVGGKSKGALLGFYFDKLSLEGAEKFMDMVSAEISDDTVSVTDDENAVVGFKVLKIYGTERQMLQFMTQLDLSDMEYEEIEDGMPKVMEEMKLPDFDTFVAFDIEHTGTYGINKGDAEAEIIEIGAVKVIDGIIVDRFNMLANPGRKIVPLVAKITHITDEMVSGEPSVNEVIIKFKEFVRDNVLVGHNIKSCDIPHIIRAGKRAGVNFDNRYYDTKQMAEKLKTRMHWERITLPYLSEYYAVKQEDAHRAWCDAEANAQVYLLMKKDLADQC